MIRQYLALCLRPVMIMLMVAAAYVAFVYLPVAYGDWYRFFRPASLAVLDPYRIRGILNPPWAFAILFPLAQLPGRLSGAGLALLSAIAVIMYVRCPWRTLATFVSAPFILVIVLGQLDALVLYGLMLPASIGSLVILIKPQGVILTLLKRISLRSFIVIAATVLSSLVIWGFWPAKMLRYGLVPDTLRNASLFPYSLPLAPILAYYGVRRKSDALLCWATLCAVPFFQTHSMLPAIAASVREIDDWRVWLLLPVLSWLYWGLTVFPRIMAAGHP